MRIALGSSRAAKVAAVRSAAVHVASIDASWRDAAIIACDVETDEKLEHAASIRSLRSPSFGRTVCYRSTRQPRERTGLLFY